MNQIKKYFFSLIARRQSTGRLLTRLSSPLIIHPFYHTVTNDYLPHLTPLYKPKTFQKFKNDLDFLTADFQAIDMEDVLLHTKGEKSIRQHAFHLSFDDGLREVYEVVLPYLYRKGIPATVFINSDFVNNQQLFYRHKAALIVDALSKREPSPSLRKEIESRLPDSPETSLRMRVLAVSYTQRELLDEIASLLEIDLEEYLKKRRPYLTTKEIYDMHKKGFSVGAHGIDHPHFSEITEEEQIRQIMDSVAFVKKTVPEPHRYFSFPFTDEEVAASVFQTIYNRGKRSINLSFGIGGIGTHYEGRHIARIDMEKYGKDAKEAVNKALIKYLMTGNTDNTPSVRRPHN
jgi:peptidoglycan/xylan/chitin deacetylase (PgdA/CDA1 family)